MAKEKGWWHDLFPEIRPLFGAISPRITNAQVRYIVKKMGLKPGMKFLDCPCGPGRISLPLAKKDIRVTGVDITHSYLEELERTAKRRGLKIELHELDMRKINFKNIFDAGGNLGTSFGYFEKESDNLMVLKEAYQALKPGGKFLLHMINRDWIMANYQAHGWDQIGSLKIVQSRDFDFRTSIMHSTWHLIENGKEKSYDISFYMYSYHELVKMLESAGFEGIEGYGSVKDEPITLKSQMMYIFGSKPRGRRRS